MIDPAIAELLHAAQNALDDALSEAQTTHGTESRQVKLIADILAVYRDWLRHYAAM